MASGEPLPGYTHRPADPATSHTVPITVAPAAPCRQPRGLFVAIALVGIKGKRLTYRRAD